MASRLRIRLHFDGIEGLHPGQKAMLGPGKADLLEAIEETGSIAAAGRTMGMSYKRAWMLVETLNAIFREPVITSVRGGADGGGAKLTETGIAVLNTYRQMERASNAAAADQIAALEAMAQGR